MIIIDANNLVLGRLAARAAKLCLMGEKVSIINCEKAVISGNKKQLLEKWRVRLHLGQPRKGPLYYRAPAPFVRRAVRGMLPHKNARGREAFSRLRCFSSAPKGLEGKGVRIDRADVTKLPNLKYVRIGELCRLIGAKA